MSVSWDVPIARFNFQTVSWVSLDLPKSPSGYWSGYLLSWCSRWEKTRLKASLDPQEDGWKLQQTWNCSCGFSSCVLTLFLPTALQGRQTLITRCSCMLHTGSSIFKMETPHVLKKPFWLLIKKMLKLENMRAKVMFATTYVSLGTQSSGLWVWRKETGKYRSISEDEVIGTRSDIIPDRQTTNE